jgi:MFS transporter, DHA3 family, tetracycline resistance protein
MPVPKSIQRFRTWVPFRLPVLPIFLGYSAVSSALLELAFTISMLYFVTQARLDPLQLVLVGTALESSIFIFEIPTGVVADVFSRRISVILGLVLLGGGFILMGAWPSFWPIIISQVLWGFGYTFTSGATQAWISDEIGEERAGSAFLKGAKFGQLGSFCGVALSVILASRQLNLPIMISGVLFILLGFFLLLTMPENGFHPVPSDERSTFQSMLSTFKKGAHLVRSHPSLGGVLAIGLFFGLYSEGFDRLWTAHLLQRFTWPSFGLLDQVIWMGILTGGALLLAAVATGLVEKRSQWLNPAGLARLMGANTLALVACLVGYAISGNFYLSVGLYGAITVFREVNSPLYTTWVNHRLDSSVRATILSLSSQVDAFGQIAGGPVIGLIAQKLSLQAGLLGSAVLLAPVLLLFAWQMRSNPAIKPAIPSKTVNL